MEYKKAKNKFIIRLYTGEEIISTLIEFCRKHDMHAGTLIGIGAASMIELSFYDRKNKKYISRKFLDDHEIAPISGFISIMDGMPHLHLHACISDEKFRAYAGHLISAIVAATFECVIEKIDAKLERGYDPVSGLNLLKL